MFFCSKYSVNKLNKINEQTVLKFSPCDATPIPFVYCINEWPYAQTFVMVGTRL